MKLEKVWKDFTSTGFFNQMRELIKEKEVYQLLTDSIIDLEFNPLIDHLQEEMDEIEEILTKRGFDLVFDYEPILKELCDLANMCGFVYAKIRLEQLKFSEGKK